MIFGSKPLFCPKGHRFDPFGKQLLPAVGSRVGCPKCGQELRMKVPYNRVQLEQRQARKLILQCLVILVLILPGWMYLFYRSISSWRIQTLAAAPDGNQLVVARATGDGNATVQIWDQHEQALQAKFGAEAMRVFLEKGEMVRFPLVLPNSKSMLLIRRDSGVKPGTQQSIYVDSIVRWDYADGKQPELIKKHYSTIRRAMIDPQGKHVLFLGSDNTFRMWEIKTGQEVSGFTCGESNCMAYEPQSRTLATGALDGNITLWDIDSKLVKKTFLAHSSVVSAMVFDPMGRLITLGGVDQTLKFWDWKNAKELSAQIIEWDWLNCLAISPDGKKLAVGGGYFQEQGPVRIWNLLDEKWEQTFHVETNSVIALTFRGDSKQVYAGSGQAVSIRDQQKQGRVYGWDLESGEQVMMVSWDQASK